MEKLPLMFDTPKRKGAFSETTIYAKKLYNDRMEPTFDEALLTAYLDGELEPLERQGLEQRLADEPELRQRLILLEETWHCLDLLEKECVDAEKIETTLKTAAIIVSMPSFLPMTTNRWGRWSIAAVAGLVLFVVTFKIGSGLPADTLPVRPIEEGNKQLAEAFEKLSPWERDELLNEEPKVIIDALNQLWNEH